MKVTSLSLRYPLALPVVSLEGRHVEKHPDIRSIPGTTDMLLDTSSAAIIHSAYQTFLP